MNSWLRGKQTAGEIKSLFDSWTIPAELRMLDAVKFNERSGSWFLTMYMISETRPDDISRTF
jgi:hypothetical protein